MMGVLAGIEEATGFDLRRCEGFVGTSAGAIVAAHLVAGNAPRRPGRTKAELHASKIGTPAQAHLAAVHQAPVAMNARRVSPIR